MATLGELIVPQTAEEIDETMVTLAAASDLPVSGWYEDAVPRTLLGIVAEVAADCWFAAAQMANGLVLRYSGAQTNSAWIDLLAESAYQEVRKPPVTTVGDILLTDAGGGPHTIAAGALVVATATGQQYRNVTGGTLPLNGTLALQVSALQAGAAGNVANGAINTLVTSLPTVTVSNPAIGLTGTWVTTLGADLETPAQLAARCSAKWGTLSTGSPESAYLYWALSVSGVTRAKVDTGNPDGPGSLRVYVDSAGSVAGVQALLNTKRAAGTKATAVLATSQAVVIDGVVTVRRDRRAVVESAAIAALNALQGEVEIGGIVIKAEVIERVMSAGAVDYQIGSGWTGTPNVTLASDKIPAFTISLTWIET